MAKFFERIIDSLSDQMPLIKTERELKKVAAESPEDEKRTVVLRAFLGGLTNAQVREHIKAAGMLSEATKAISNARAAGSAEPVLWFAANAGRNRRRLLT